MPKITAMTYADLLEFFKSQGEIARAFGISQASVCEWQKNGVPPLRQVQGELLTKKKLKADSDIYKKQTDRARAA